MRLTILLFSEIVNLKQGSGIIYKMSSTDAAVKVYSTTWCAYCRMVREYLDKLGVAFKDIDIEQDPAAGQYIMSKTHSAGVPQIEIGEQVILGFDRPRIDAALKQNQLIN